MNKALLAFPDKISNDIFKSYYFCSIGQSEACRNTGIVIDDGLFEFIFLKETDIQVETNGQKKVLPQAFIIGKVGIPSRLIIPDKMTCFTIKIQPWVASFFLGKTYTSIINISKNLYPGIGALHDQIFNSMYFEEQIKCVEDFFLKQDLPNISNCMISKEICNHIYEKHGDIKIKDLLSLFPHSRQKLNQLFQEETKNSIKEFAIYTRLRSIMSYRMNFPQKSLTSIAYQFGYFDQAHFIKDMKKITGVTPSEFYNSNNIFYEQIKSHA